MQKPKVQIILFGLLAMALVLGYVLLRPGAASGCHDDYRNDITISSGGRTIDAQAALTMPQQERGLGGHNCLPPGKGMFFVFSKSGYYSFWMKDMRFPIDIIWIDKSGNVVYELQNVQPASYPKSYVNQKPAKYVLEIGAGQAQNLGIRTGSHFSFSAHAKMQL